VIPLAVLVSILGMGGTARETLAEVGQILLMGGGLVVVLYLFVTQVAVRALGALTIERTRELTTLLSVLLGLASAWAAHAAGVSPAIGSFLAGMILGASPFATQVRADIASFRIVLLTLFFSAVGMKSDPLWIKNHLPLVLGTSAALILGKSVLTWGVLRLLGTPNRIAASAGLSLAQIGEFAFVLGGIGVAGGFMSEQTNALVVSCAIVTLFATPSLVAYGPRIAGWIFRRGSSPIRSGDSCPVTDVVIIGFGPAGQGVARALAERSESAVVLDLNRDAIKKAGEFGLSGQVGDATQLDVLEHAGVQRAQLVAITIPSGDMALAALRQVRALAPRVPVIVRSRYERRAAEFSDCGAHAVVGDEEEVANALGRAVLTAIVDDRERGEDGGAPPK
jgi:CPA2 family monovalent cation:H+ antiporter-2